MDDCKRQKALIAATMLSVMLPAFTLTHASKQGVVEPEMSVSIPSASLQQSSPRANPVTLSEEHWLPAEPQTAKVWLTYSDDYAIKRVIDFGKDQVRVSYRGTFLADSSPNSLRQDVEEFLQLTVAEAYRLSGMEPDFMVKPEQLNAPLLNLSQAQAKRLYFAAQITRTKGDLGDILTITIKLPSDSLQKRAKNIQPVVDELAKTEQVSSALVMAILHEENAFNFLQIKSVKPQAGDSMLGGKKERGLKKEIKQLALLNEQFSAIENDESRQLCVIAAYRAGVNEVVRVFTGRTSLSQALPLVNQLSPRQVRGQLRSQLSIREGGEYVQQVTSFLALYD